jgi:hypothetical protein
LAELSGARSAGEEPDGELRSPREGSKLPATSTVEEIVPSETRLGSVTRALPKDADAAKQMADVLAELQAIGAVDPAAQERLLEDLRQTDPALWPQAIAYARATIEYQRKTRGETTTQQSTAPPQFALPAPPSAASTTPNAAPGATPSRVTQAAHTAPTVTSAAGNSVEPAVFRASATAPVAATVIPATATTTSASPTTPNPIGGPPHIPPPSTGAVELTSVAPVPNATPPTAAPPFAAPTMPTTVPSAVPAGLDAAIAALVSGDQVTPQTSNATAAAQTLEAAAARLRDAGPLGLAHLAFCTEVNSYGVYKPFEKFEFTAGQEVLLYAEVDGFKAEPHSDGFRTTLSSGYVIVDSQGTTVDTREFGVTEEVCRNRRRDYFIRYQFHLPQQLAAGTYTLRLKMTDALSQKAGEATIDFSIKQK